MRMSGWVDSVRLFCNIPNPIHLLWLKERSKNLSHFACLYSACSVARLSSQWPILKGMMAVAEKLC